MAPEFVACLRQALLAAIVAASLGASAIAQETVVSPLLPCDDPEGAQETVEDNCEALVWIPVTLPGPDASWFWCLPPASDLVAESLSSPAAFKSHLHEELCTGLEVCQSCWPPSMRTDDGLAQVYKWWVINSLVERAAGEDSNCDGLTAIFADAATNVDLPALASATGTSLGQLKADIAAAWFAQYGAAWAGAGFCTAVKTCLPGVLGFTPSAAQFASITASVSGAIGDCGFCGGAPDRWGDVSEGDQDGNDTDWDCGDLSSLLTSSMSCYPPQGEAGAMTKAQVLTVTAEFIEEANTNCGLLIGCLDQWLAANMPSEGPLTSTEIATLAAAGDSCEIELNAFPPDFIIDPDGDAYSLWDLSDCGLCGIGPGIADPLQTLSCNNPDLWIAPVDLRYGDKVERETDLMIPWSGGSFALSRTYRSEPSWTPEPMSGAKWSLSSFARARENAATPPTTVEFGVNTGLQAMAPISITSGALATIGGTPLSLAGPTHQTVQSTQVCVDEKVIPIYRVAEPGR